MHNWTWPISGFQTESWAWETPGRSRNAASPASFTDTPVHAINLWVGRGGRNGQAREMDNSGKENLRASQGQSGVYFKKCKRNRESSLFTKHMFYVWTFSHPFWTGSNGQPLVEQKSRKARTSHWTAVTKMELMISSSGLGRDPREGIHFLVQLFVNEEEKIRGRFTAKLNKNDQQFSLHVEDSQFHDATNFLCATGTGAAQTAPRTETLPSLHLLLEGLPGTDSVLWAKRNMKSFV